MFTIPLQPHPGACDHAIHEVNFQLGLLSLVGVRLQLLKGRAPQALLLVSVEVSYQGLYRSSRSVIEYQYSLSTGCH
jgi:hypothetical protein